MNVISNSNPGVNCSGAFIPTKISSEEICNGVDSDYEMQMLLQIEQAYAANAKVVQTVESMIQTLMEL